MITKVISGGQTGADIAGLQAARAVGIRTGGWAPRGYRTEEGPRPNILRGFGLKEHPSAEYPPRTAKNIKESDCTLIVTMDLTIDGGSALTRDLCFKMKKPSFHITGGDMRFEPRRQMTELLDWLKARRPQIVNVAGNRESKAIGLEELTVPFLTELFRRYNAQA